MSNDRHNLPGHGTMEDYTTPFLVVAAVLCWMALVFVWAIFGILGATITALAADRAIPRRSQSD